ncbi:MAG: thiolase domain-containing protein [Anaerolineales bacterium]
MEKEVAIVGIGWEGFQPTTPSYSYKELIYQAAQRAYYDANVDPRKDIDSFVSVAEDFIEGTSIFDEYTPDQLGAALKPMHTITGDGLHGVITAYMMIRSGLCKIVAVEAHSKASNVKTLPQITHYALDPVLNRPFEFHPEFIAGLEMSRFLHDSQLTLEDCALVVQKNRRNALDNPSAPYGCDYHLDEIQNSQPLAFPLLESYIAQPADGAIVIVLANAEIAKSLTIDPVWIIGVGWCNDSYNLELRDWGDLPYVTKAAQMAYRQAQINNPTKYINFAEVDDLYAYRELMTLSALGLVSPCELPAAIRMGKFHPDGDLPVNVSGGNLGMGNLLDANGAAKLIEAVLQLRQKAGKRQLPLPNIGLVQSWRGIPTSSTAVVILANG